MAAAIGALPKRRGQANYPVFAPLVVTITTATSGVCPINTAEAETIIINGTTAITSFGVAPSGAVRNCRAAASFTITHNATSLFCVTGASIAAVANDTFTMVSLGVGNWYMHSYSRATGAALVAAGPVNWTEAVNSAAPNGTIPVVSWTPNNAASGVDAVILPKGTNSAFILAIPDNLTLGGNKRGSAAVDLQLTRGAATDVAGGNNSFIGNGLALAIDPAATYAAIVGGGTNQILAAGLFGCIGGGYTNTVDGQFATVPGGANAKTRGVQGTLAYASGLFAQNGDAQTTMFVLRGTSAGGTSPIKLTTDGASTPSATNCPNLTTNAASFFSAYAVGHDIINGSNAVAIKLEGLVTRNTGGGLNVALVGTPVATVVAASVALAGTTLTVTVDTTLQCLVFTGTSVTGSNIQWVCRVWITEEQG